MIFDGGYWYEKRNIAFQKKDIVSSYPWEFKSAFGEEEIRWFSREQLTLLAEIFSRSRDISNRSNPFYSLSATEVLQKSSGKIAFFDIDAIREETHEECMNGPSALILADYCKKKS